MHKQHNRLTALDGMRGIFAFLVMCFHFSADPRYDPLSLTNNFLFRQSFVFVDFFFVLSGFVIAYNYLARIKSGAAFKDYLIKRFIRLYPLLLWSVLVYVPLKLYGIYVGFEFNDEVYGYAELVKETLDSLLFMNSTPILGSTEAMNPVSWSISAEMIAYLTFGALLVLFRKQPVNALLVLWLALLVFFLVHQNMTEAGRYGFLRGLFGFTGGVLVFELYQCYPAKWDWAEWPYMIVLLALIYLVDMGLHPLTMLGLTLWFGMGVFIFSRSRGSLSRALDTKPFQFLGRISYSFYLNHYFVLWLVYYLLWNLVGLPPTHLTVIVSFLIVTVTTLVYSQFTYTLIEKRMGFWLKSKWLK